MCQRSLNGGLVERPLHEAVKLKPGLPWKTQGVRDVRVWDTCRRELLMGSGTSPRERSVLHAVNKGKHGWGPEELFDIRHKNTEVRVCPTGFLSCFGLVFPIYAPFPALRNGNAYPVPLYVRSM